MEMFKQEAIEFLKQEFHPDLNYDLHLETTFNNHPIKGAQPTELYSFEVQSETHEKFFVFAGNVHPMVYPDYGLTVDELWPVHLGLEYFIEQGVKEDTERKPQLLLTYRRPDRCPPESSKRSRGPARRSGRRSRQRRAHRPPASQSGRLATADAGAPSARRPRGTPRRRPQARRA